MTTMTNNSMTSLVLAVLASAAFIGFAAVPAEASEVREARVEVVPSELSTAAGRKAVQGRVLQAAKDVCANTTMNIRNLNEMASINLCVANALRDGQAQMAAIASKTQLASR